MAQKPYKIVFFGQNKETLRTCTKHKTKDIYYVTPIIGNYALYVYDKDEAIRILNSKEPVDLEGRLETGSQEEIEKITPENIEQKSVEFLERFNKNFKLNVSYTPTEEEMDLIDERMRKTVWNKENIFLLNFYMMEATKRKFNFSWTFRKTKTFNPFYVPEYVDRLGLGSSYYTFLKPPAKKFFSIKYVLGLITGKEMMDNANK